MAKKTYDSSSVSFFPNNFKMVLPDGYRIDTEYDEDNNEIVHLRGDFGFNEDGEETFAFSAGFTKLDVNIKEDGDMESKRGADGKFPPSYILDQVAEGVMENLQSQFGPGTRLNLYNSFPASTIMKFYKPILMFGINVETYIVFYLVEASENDMFGIQTVYQNNEEGNQAFFKHMLNVIKAVRVDEKAVDIGNLTPNKLEQALDMECDEDVEALDLGLSVGISFHNGDEETQYTLNNDGSVTTERNGEVVDITDELDDEDDEADDNWDFGLFNSYAEPAVRVAEDNSRKIIVDNAWSFELPDDLEFKFDAEHRDILGNSATAQYLVEGLQFGENSLFDFELHEIFDMGISAEFDVLGCRYDNDVTSGNAQQKIIRDDDALYVDIKGKQVFFSKSTVQIRVRGDGLKPWDFVMGVDGNDEDLMSRWDEIKDLYKKLAESIQLLEDNNVSNTSKKDKNKDQQHPDFIISDGVLRRYIGKDIDIVIPEGVREIGDSTFSGFTKIRSVVVPEGVKRIGNRSFENCLNLEECILPDSIEEIGEYAFVDCHELKEIHLNDNINHIGGSAFSECFALNDVIIPSNIKEIDNFSFKNCKAFTHMVIPNGVTSIGATAFAWCDNLEYLFIPESVSDFTVDFMNNTPFSGSDKLKIYTPSGSDAERFATENGIPYETYDGATEVKDKTTSISGWGQNVTVEGKVVEDITPKETISSNSGWGQNITVEGKELGGVDAKETKDTGSGWGQGITVDGKKL